VKLATGGKQRGDAPSWLKKSRKRRQKREGKAQRKGKEEGKERGQKKKSGGAKDRGKTPTGVIS